MKKPLLFILFLLTASYVSAQQTADTAGINGLNSIPLKPPAYQRLKQPHFIAVEDEPEFPGGTELFLQFISRNIRYPLEAYQKHEQGKVYVQFVIKEDGSVANAIILRGVSPSLDSEALRVVRLSPRWKAGIQNGQPVSVQFSVPITFNLGALPPQTTDTSHVTKTGDSAEDELAAAKLTPQPIQESFEQNNDEIFSAVEHEPEFPGGPGAFKYFVQQYEQQHFPDITISGKVVLNFVVEKDGSLTDIKVIRASDTVLVEPSITIVKNMPKFVPGKQNDRVVRVYYTIPINFGNN